jgi:hypothetical protein
LAGVPLADAATDTLPEALGFEIDDDLALLGVPHPSGFTVVTRSGLTVAPRVLESDSVNRDGSISSTITGFTSVLTGTRTVPTVDGDVDATLASFTPSFVGEFGFRHYFNISYSLTPTWVVYEQPANFGAVTPTLSGFTASYAGYSLPPDSTQGSISTTLSGFTPAFTGTLTAPPSYAGAVSCDISAFAVGLAGSALPPSGFLGSVDLTLDGFTSDISGTFSVFTTDGAWASTLGDFALSYEGQFISASTNNGTWQSDLGGFDFALNGVGPLSITLTSRQATLDAKERHRMFVSGKRTRKFEAE